jgi:saccharopine dehydrogenase-like NADP-dependent oxidoreductase
VEIGRKMVGRTCVGSWIIGEKDGMERSVFLYQSTDNQECLKLLDCQAVVAQTAFAPAIVLELLAKGIWKDEGVYSLEYFDPDPFVERMEAYGFPGAMVEKHSEYRKKMDAAALLVPLSQ